MIKPDDEVWEAGGEMPSEGVPIDPDAVVPAANRQRAVTVLRAALADVERGDLSPDAVEQQIAERLYLLRTKGGSSRSLADVLEAAYTKMDARCEGREKPIATPWADLNEQLPGGGYWPGCHIHIGGTGSGKSTYTLQLALHAAMNGAAVAYVGLELDDEQIALRLAGEVARVGWSHLYTGRATEHQRTKAREAGAQLANLPITLEAGDPLGWAASRMQTVAKDLRKRHPEAPVLIVVDFLQLVGSEPDAGRQDLRERIGRAAYVARDVARRYGATVILVSSVSRENYAKVSGAGVLTDAGLALDKHNGIVVERSLRGPEAIVGLGKESGEIEYAADSVTVAIGLPREQKAESRQVVFAVPKRRAGVPSWCCLRFDGFRFSDDHSHGQDVMTAIEGAKEANATKKGKPKKTPKTGNGQSADCDAESSSWARHPSMTPTPEELR